MEYTSNQVLEALKKVVYPGSDKDIVSLGMIEDLAIEGKKISFSLKFKKSNDPLISSIKKACVQAIINELGEDAGIKGNISVKTEEKPRERKVLPGVKNIIAVASGKGGVGKSTVAVNLSVALANSGYRTGLIDADVYGPSIPKMINTENAKPFASEGEGNKTLIAPIEKYGVKMLSLGFFVEAKDALVWRGPMATSALKQLINDGDWGELDYLIIDLPPGTGDIHLTMVQEVPVTGAVIVSTPQEVALADAVKGINMFQQKNINVPVLGLVENMSWFTPEELPDNKYYIFGKEGCKKLSEEMNIPLLGQIPIVQSIREGGDKGYPSALDDNAVGKAFHELAVNMTEQTELRNENQQPTKRVEIKS